MSKYYLKLQDNVIPRVSNIVSTNFFRAETKKTTLNGGLTVDRGDVKIRLDVTVKVMSASEVKALEKILNEIIILAEFYNLDTLTNLTMVTEPISSKTEVYLYGDRTKGVYYTNVKFTLEEQ